MLMPNAVEVHTIHGLESALDNDGVDGYSGGSDNTVQVDDL